MKLFFPLQQRGSSLQPQNSSGRWLHGAAVASPLASHQLHFQSIAMGIQAAGVFLDPRNFKTAFPLGLLLFLCGYATISEKLFISFFFYLIGLESPLPRRAVVPSNSIRDKGEPLFECGMWTCSKSRVVLLLAALQCN